MNLDKLTIPLCFAFQQGEGPFKVCIEYNNKKEWRILLRDDIKRMSDLENVVSISLAHLSEERRSPLSMYIREKLGQLRERRRAPRFT